MNKNNEVIIAFRRSLESRIIASDMQMPLIALASTTPMPDTHERLLKYNNKYIRAAIASNRYVGRHIIRSIIYSNDMYSQLALVDNEAVGVDMIRELAKRCFGDSDKLRCAIASNEKSPGDVLLKLVNFAIGRRELPLAKALLSNPKLPGSSAILLSSIGGIGADYLRHPNISDNVFIGLLEKNGMIFNEMYAALDNPSISDSMIIRFCLSLGKSVYPKIANKQNLSEQSMRMIIGRGDLKAHIALSSREHLPDSIVQMLIETRSCEVLDKLARSADISQESILKIYEIAKGNNYLPVLASIAQNVASPGNILQELSLHESNVIKSEAAGNISTPPDALSEMFKNNKSTMVLEKLASNINTPAGTLEKLSECNPVVKMNVAANPKTHEQVLNYMYNFASATGDVDLLVALISNENLPHYILNKMVDSDSTMVLTALTCRLEDVRKVVSSTINYVLYERNIDIEGVKGIMRKGHFDNGSNLHSLMRDLNNDQHKA